MYYLFVIFLLVEYAVVYHVPKAPPSIVKEEATAPAEVKSDAKSEAKTEQKQQTNVEPAAPSVPEKKEAIQEAPTGQKHASVEAATPLIPAEKKEAKIEEAPVGKAELPAIEDKTSQVAPEKTVKKEDVPKEKLRVTGEPVAQTPTLIRAKVIECS